MHSNPLRKQELKSETDCCCSDNEASSDQRKVSDLSKSMTQALLGYQLPAQMLAAINQDLDSGIGCF